MTGVAVPPAWALVLARNHDVIEEAFGAELGFPIHLAANTDRRIVVATVDHVPDGDQVDACLDMLAKLWPGTLASARVGCELVVTQDGGQMAVRAAH